MFRNLTGNETAKTQLKRLIAGGRVPNALLFAGPEGVGKKLFAVELARTFVCSDPIDGEGCGKCSACLRAGEIVIPSAEKGEEYDRIFFGQHADVGMVVPFKRNLRVGSIRALEREANFRPYEATIRFFIVNDADKMNDSAANALLKTLEEPPATTHIVLIASRPDSLLQTIRSRSQMIRFSPVAGNKIETLLTQKHQFSSEDARLAACVSGGSIGRAVAIDLEKFRAARERFLNVVANAARGRGRAEMLQIAEQLNDAKNKDDFEENLVVLETLIHDVWLAASGGNPEEMTNSDIRDEIAGMARGLPQTRPAAWHNEIETMRQNFAVNINRKIATDALFVKMAA
jgi:DNA polymerase-3 subunit delta'